MPSSCCKHRTPATLAPAAAHCLGCEGPEAPLLLCLASAPLWLELPGSCSCLLSPCIKKWARQMCAVLLRLDSMQRAVMHILPSSHLLPEP